MRVRFCFVLVFLIAATFAAGVAASSSSTAADIHPSLQRDIDALEPARRDAFERTRPLLAGNDTAREMECLLFLIRNMPPRDLALNVSMIADTINLALLARRTMPWGETVPWSLFLNDVLPYSVLAEPRDPWRPFFWRYFTRDPYEWPELVQMPMSWIPEYLNAFLWDIDKPRIHFVEGPPDGINAYSPFEVIARGNSSCTGLSITMVAALRTLGIPARVAGTPHWNLGPTKCPNGDASPACGNHNWVEAWVDGGWNFVDEAGENLILNTSWFFPAWAEHQVPHGLNHTIFATSWSPSAAIEPADRFDPLAAPVKYFPMVWDWYDDIASAFDVTRRYLAMLPKKKEHGGSVADAAVNFAQERVKRFREIRSRRRH